MRSLLAGVLATNTTLTTFNIATGATLENNHRMVAGTKETTPGETRRKAPPRMNMTSLGGVPNALVKQRQLGLPAAAAAAGSAPSTAAAATYA